MAVIECGEFKTVDEVVLGHARDLSLFGARTLEGFNAVIDARKRKLIAAAPCPPPELTGIRADPVGDVIDADLATDCDASENSTLTWGHPPVPFV